VAAVWSSWIATPGKRGREPGDAAKLELLRLHLLELLGSSGLRPIGSKSRSPWILSADAHDCEDKHGHDQGNGWLLNHPLRKFSFVFSPIISRGLDGHNKNLSLD